MSWLKDILEENRRVVDSWSAWKKGSIMTRKEELEQRAINLADGHYECEDAWYSCPLSHEGCADDSKGSVCTCGGTKRQAEIYQALQQVEREVLEMVEKQAREFSVLYPMDVWRDSSKKEMTARIMVSFADWLKEQQKELG